MIQVRVSAGLIEKLLETGSTTSGVVTVTQGLPKGAELAYIEFDRLRGYAMFYFIEEGHHEDRELEIILQSSPC